MVIFFQATYVVGTFVYIAILQLLMTWFWHNLCGPIFCGLNVCGPNFFRLPSLNTQVFLGPKFNLTNNLIGPKKNVRTCKFFRPTFFSDPKVFNTIFFFIIYFCWQKVLLGQKNLTIHFLDPTFVFNPQFFQTWNFPDPKFFMDTNVLDPQFFWTHNIFGPITFSVAKFVFTQNRFYVFLCSFAMTWQVSVDPWHQ